MAAGKEWAFYSTDPRRHSLLDATEARVEFDDPFESGRRWQLGLINVSEGGLCFEAGPDFPELPRNAELHGFTVRVGGLVFRGDFVASHVRREDDGSFVCGGQFRPATEVDEITMRKVIAERGAVGQPG